MQNWLETSKIVVIQIVLLVGLLGLVVPIFPGLFIMWLATLGYGVLSGFSTPGVVIFILLTVLMLAGSIVDNVLMGAGARFGGASWLSIAVALIAGIVGTIVLPPFGGIIAAPLAVLLLEYARHKDVDQAWNALKGLAAGWGLSFFVRFGIGILMILLWWLWVWKG